MEGDGGGGAEEGEETGRKGGGKGGWKMVRRKCKMEQEQVEGREGIRGRKNERESEPARADG